MIAVKMGKNNFILPDEGYDAFVEFLYHTPSQPELLGIKKRDIIAAYKSSCRTVGGDKDWYTNYNALKSYHAKHGNCSVPFGKESGSLRSWTERQKKLNASSKLEPVKVDRMKALDFDFTVKKPLSACSVNNLPIKRAEPDVAATPASTAREIKPAQLNKKQSSKKQKKEVSFSSLPAAAKAPMVRKSSIVFEDEHTWKKHHEALKAFQAKHGHCSVPFGKETGALRSWTERQNRLYASSKLETDKFNKMTELGYDFRS